MTGSQDNDSPETSRWPWFLLGLALLAMAGGVYWWMAQPQEQGQPADMPPPLVRVAQAAPAQTVTLRQTGFVRAVQEVDVVTQISERITEIGPQFEVGTRIEAGALLVALDATRFVADRAEAQARLEQARASLTDATLALSRQTRLAAENFASEAALDDAQVAVARAEADLAMARAQAQRADLAVEDARLTAPFDALVTEQTASPGQFVQAGTPIGHLVATASAEIRMGLLPSDIAVLGTAEAAVGLTVALTDPTTRRSLGTGTVTGIVPVIEAETRTVSLIVRVPDPFAASGHGPLRIGELVQMQFDVPLGQNLAVRVTAEALKGADTVWRIASDALEPLTVTLVARDGDSVVIRHPDLAAGDTLLQSDLVAPAAGQLVRIAPPDTDHLADRR